MEEIIWFYYIRNDLDEQMKDELLSAINVQVIAEEPEMEYPEIDKEER
jgi:hypothetical protein